MSDTPGTAAGGTATPTRTRPLAETPALAGLAAELLDTDSMLAGMTDAERRCVVSYLRLVGFGAATTIFREGDAANTSYMLLILSGEIRVEANAFAGGDAVEIAVLGAGNVIGEMGLIDGAARSTTCTAVTAVQAGGLSRKALDLMLVEHPAVAAKLMIVLAKRMADRLRALGDQLGIYARLADDAQRELERVRGMPRH